MKSGTLTILFLSFIFLSLRTFAQANSLEFNPEKEKIYNPFMWGRHSGIDGLADFKKDHPHEYLKELWYYSESFYIRRNYLKEGVEMSEVGLDISRFEYARKENEEAILVLPGYKDALVLLPLNRLIYKP
jgi:hypothetical protein